MIPIGDVYRFKAEVEEELTPSFHAAIMSSLGKPYPTSFGDANYVFSITCFTEPLKRSVRQFYPISPDLLNLLKKAHDLDSERPTP